MSKQPEGQGRTFTAKSQAGDIPAGHTFTEEAFRDLHPLPRDPKQARINPDAYHGDLLARLLSLGVIEEVKDVEPQPIPDGPTSIAQTQAELQAPPEPIPAQPGPAMPKAK